MFKDYLSILSGTAGRLVISVAYFVAVANALSLGDFGLFATASATGIVVSRLSALGFISPLYRTATVRRRLMGVYTAGFITAFIISLPVLVAASWMAFALLFDGAMPWKAFVAVMVAEVICWRLFETVLIVNNGLNHFATSASLGIFGFLLRAAAAVGFFASGSSDLTEWSLAYMAANGLSMLIGLAFFYPRVKLRWKPRAWLARARDSLSVSAADVMFYLQMELDKILVLAVGGSVTAGLYAIVMRLVDLTAVPVRTFNVILVQRLMRERGRLYSIKMRILIEATIAIVSVSALLALVILLSFAPNALGSSIAQAANVLVLVLLVPAFRNLVEYHAELLYARENTTARAILLGVIGALKAALLVALLAAFQGFETQAIWLNPLFAALYLVSAVATYTLLAREKPVAAAP